jgi:hypothetical protein
MIDFDPSMLKHDYPDDPPAAEPGHFNPDDRADVVAMMNELQDDEPFQSTDEVEHVESVMHDELDAEPSDREHVRKYLAKQRQIHRMLNE